ncbi:MAG: GntR family transcriptional regulator, partial [Lautropia mirabilis]
MDANYKISRSSLHVEVTDRLREMIYERSLPPGERIDELGLSARLGTSRTPLREALKVLAHEGLVRLVPGRGAFVIELSASEAESLFPVLGLLQSRCAAEAVRRQTPEDIAALDTLLASLENAVTGNRLADYYRAVDGFHERLQAMAANPWLTRSITDLGRFLQMVRTLMPLPENRLRQSMAEYRTLMKAIHRGDADAAEQIVYLQAMAQQRAWRMLQQQAQETAAAQEAATQGADAAASVPASSAATTSSTTIAAEAPSPSLPAGTAHANPQGN